MTNDSDKIEIDVRQLIRYIVGSVSDRNKILSGDDSHLRYGYYTQLESQISKYFITKNINELENNVSNDIDFVTKVKSQDIANNEFELLEFEEYTFGKRSIDLDDFSVGITPHLIVRDNNNIGLMYLYFKKSTKKIDRFVGEYIATLLRQCTFDILDHYNNSQSQLFTVSSHLCMIYDVSNANAIQCPTKNWVVINNPQISGKYNELLQKNELLFIRYANVSHALGIKSKEVDILKNSHKQIEIRDKHIHQILENSKQLNDIIQKLKEENKSLTAKIDSLTFGAKQFKVIFGNNWGCVGLVSVGVSFSISFYYFLMSIYEGCFAFAVITIFLLSFSYHVTRKP